MNWSDVGNWVKDNAGTGAKLVGSLLTGGVPGAIATGISLINSATGESDPDKALEKLKMDPETTIKLRELAIQEEASIRAHIETMEKIKLEDAQNEHSETQKTIRAGDVSVDEKIRNTRPTMARQGWFATISYCVGCFGVLTITGEDIFDVTIASILSAPAWAYLGLRTGDKFAGAWKDKR